jgi:hypothetical protein
MLRFFDCTGKITCSKGEARDVSEVREGGYRSEHVGFKLVEAPTLHCILASRLLIVPVHTRRA